MHVRSVGELLTKLRWAWRQGVLAERLRIFSRRWFFHPLQLWIGLVAAYLRLSPEDRRLPLSRGICDHRGHVQHHRPDPDHLERIVAAYKASKTEQAKITGPFEIRGQWGQWWIAENFRPLVHALDSGDVPALAALYENLQRDRFAIGLGTSSEELTKPRILGTRSLYLRTVWCEYRDKLLSYGFAPEQIRAPLIGNPFGVRFNGDVLTINTLRHLHHAAEMRDWLSDIPQATVVEIGGGFGGQAYQTIRLASPGIAKYVIFDIPEAAAIASYYLMAALPNHRIRLFGEGTVSVAADEPYDVAVFPHFAIGQLAADSVDLFHNACSFAEMDSASSLEYLRIIERTCRRYFSHINHETNFTFLDSDGATSRNVIGSKLIPDTAKFKRVFKKPRVFFLPEDELERFVSYEYLYEQRRTVTRSAG